MHMIKIKTKTLVTVKNICTFEAAFTLQEFMKATVTVKKL